MKAIGDIVKETSISQSLHSTLPTKQDSNKALPTTSLTLTDLDLRFAPTKWGYVANNPEKAYQAYVLCLVHIENTYGRPHAAMWIRTQVLALFGSSSCKDEGIADGIKLFADSFATEVKGFKLSELMLFFARYKAGRYDNSYSSFDVRRIGNAFFKEFLPERNRELDKLTRLAEQERIEQRQAKIPEGYTSLSWYLELKKRAENGDEEAQKMITHKL